MPTEPTESRLRQPHLKKQSHHIGAGKRRNKPWVGEGLLAAFTALREELNMPSVLAYGELKHPAAYVQRVLAMTQLGEGKDTREYIKDFLAAPASFSNSDVGLAALQFESLLIEKFRDLYNALVETQVEPGAKDFLAVFEGKVAPDRVDALRHETEAFCDLHVIMQAGDVSPAARMRCPI